MTLPRTRAGRGFTLIELLVVVAVTLVLFALLLPAVQSAREAARRAMCINNMSQLALALQHYQSQHQVFPSGVVDGAGPIVNMPAGYHMSWIVQILPEFGQGTAFNRLNFAYGAYATENLTIANVRLSTLICPSTPSQFDDDPDQDEALRLSSHEQSSYAGCYHHREARIGRKNRGMLFLNSSIRPEDVSDGTSQTIILGEKLPHLGGLGWMSGTRATLRNTGSRPNSQDTAAIDRSLKLDEAGLDVLPSPDAVIKRPDGTVTLRSIIDPAGGFSARHPGGVNTAFADGSVKFIKDTVTAAVMKQLGNRNDGELLDNSGF